MQYTLTSNVVLLELDRTSILDISPGDAISPSLFPGAVYEWKEQDSQFVESNPDSRLLVRFEEKEKGRFTGTGLLVLPNEDR